MKRLLLLIICLLSFGCIENNEVKNIKTIKIEEVQTFKVEIAKEIGTSISENPAVVNLCASYGLSSSNSTGFFINYKKRIYLITAKHSVENAKNISALHIKTGAVFFTIKKYKLSEKHDIAAFLVESKNKLNCLSLSNINLPKSIPEIDIVSGLPEGWKPIPCKILGYPGEWGFRECNGNITHKLKMPLSSYVISTCDTGSGLSGAPWIVKKTGKVIAIHSSTLGEGKNRRSGGISIEYLIPLLDEMK